jgi:flagellar biogenesis protein FliO
MLCAVAAWAQDEQQVVPEGGVETGVEAEALPEEYMPEEYTAEEPYPGEAEADIEDPLVRDVNRNLAARQGAEEGGGPLGGTQTQPLINAARWFVSVCIVVALVLILAWAVRRFGGKTPFLAGADLGQVIGRIYLNRQAALYYVETGGRVLLVGVTNNNVSLVSEFDADAFDEDAEDTGMIAPSDAETFLSQLEESSRAMRAAPRPKPANAAAPASQPLERDMASMKSELERMRRMLANEED